MKINYSIDKNDILENHLYIISKMKQFEKDNKEMFFSFIGILALLNIVILYKRKYLDFSISFSVTLLYIFFRKKTLNYYYKFHTNWKIKKLIKDNPKIIGSKEIEFIEKSKISTETRHIIDLTEVNSINEIKEYYFIRLKNKSSITIPKSKLISTDSEEVNLFLKELSKNLNIDYIEDLNWKW